MTTPQTSPAPATGRLPFLQGPGLPLYLAPMAGFTDCAFRQLCKEYGADVMVTEFVRAEKFLDARGEADAFNTIDFTPAQRPMGVQIFGGDPAKMAEAADVITDRLQPDFLDINYGCPAPKVVHNCAGSSLLREPALLQEIASATVRRVGDRLPVTAKIRIGWDEHCVNAMEIGQRLVEAGIEALAIHGRTKEQGYRGEADWETIFTVAQTLPIPVIGNGSIRDASDVRRIRQGGCVRGLMIGRAALGNPFLFREIKHALRTGESLPPPTMEERWQVLLRYGSDLLRHRNRDPWDSINWMRPRLKAFAKNVPGSKALRRQLEQVTTLDELQAISGQACAPSHSLNRSA